MLEDDRSAAGILVASIVRPLDHNAELQLAAAAELQRELASHPTATDAELATATAVLDRADARPKRRQWLAWLTLLMLALTLPPVARTGFHYVQLGHYFAWLELGYHVDEFPYLPPPDELMDLTAGPNQFLIRDLNPQQALLFLGQADPSGDELSEPLWRSEPNNPAYYAEHSLACWNESGRLPNDFATTAARIDPDNGWFPLLAAMQEARGNQQRAYHRTDYVLGHAPQWKIRDKEKMERCLARLHEGMALQRVESYRKSMLLRRGPLVPAPEAYLDHIALLRCAGLWPDACAGYHELAQSIAAAAQELAARGDRDGFLRLLGDWRKLVLVATDDIVSHADLLYARLVVTVPLDNLRDAAKELDCGEDAKALATLEEDVRAKDLLRRGRPLLDNELVGERGAVLAQITVIGPGRFGGNAPGFTEDDLRSGLEAEHSVYQRFFTLAAWLLLLVSCVVAILQRYRHGWLARELATRAVDLLQKRDWAWIFGLGVVVPLLLFLLVTRVTPLSARHWSLGEIAFIQPAGQLACLLVVWLILPAVVIAWRLGKRGHFLGMAGGWASRPHGIVAAVVAALSMPTFALPAWNSTDLREGVIPLPWFLLGICVLWWLILVATGFLSTRLHAVRTGTLFRALIPAWVFAILLLGVSLPFLEWEERHWLQQDQLMRPHPEVPCISLKHKEILDAMLPDHLDLVRRCQQ